MTIRVEREALLRVISRAPSGASVEQQQHLIDYSSKPAVEDEFVIVELPNKPFQGDAFFYEYEDDQIPELIKSTDDEEDDSLCSLSTDSSTTAYSSSSSNDELRRVVSFATDLVTEVWTRETTHPDDVAMLFYSALETQTFRQEYRLERKVLNELSIDPETFPIDDEETLSNLVAMSSSTSGAGSGAVFATTAASTSSSPASSSSNGLLTSPNFRHGISRVVVLHNDKLETFFNPNGDSPADEDDVFLEPESAAASVASVLSPLFLEGGKREDQQQPRQLQEEHQQETSSCNGGCSSSTSSSSSIDDSFFDNDCFWSGSLTWY